MNILILGHKGMLGSMCLKYFTDLGYAVSTIQNRFPEEVFKTKVISFSGDFIINCIGSIPQKSNNFSVNYELPIWLDNNSPCRVIHPDSDYTPSSNGEYEISKKRAFDYLLSNSKKTKIIKCSIIGPEVNSVNSLFEWFMNSKVDVYGHTLAIWNGVTTLEWAKHCFNLMNFWVKYPLINTLYSESVSKLDLLLKIKRIFDRNINIIPLNVGENRELRGNIECKDLDTQLFELREFIKKTEYYGEQLPKL